MRFGLKDVNELPSMEEFEKLVAESFQSELVPAEKAGESLGNSSTETDDPAEAVITDADLKSSA